MSEQFKAQALDLDLELTLLGGEVEKLTPKIKTNTTTIIKIMEKFEKFEAEQKELDKKKKEGTSHPFNIIATELSWIYDKKPEWFLDNFDPSTLADIIKYVARTMGGAQKNGKGSS